MPDLKHNLLCIFNKSPLRALGDKRSDEKKEQQQNRRPSIYVGRPTNRLQYIRC